MKVEVLHVLWLSDDDGTVGIHYSDGSHVCREFKMHDARRIFGQSGELWAEFMERMRAAAKILISDGTSTYNF